MKKRKVYKKTSKGVKIVYRKKNISKLRCSCGAELHGIPRLTASRFRKLAKSKRKASRPYSNLCSKCMREKLAEVVN